LGGYVLLPYVPERAVDLDVFVKGGQRAAAAALK
jgi:hypothetical protein